jgi:membrane protease YdiL (CAAX protease family)
VTETVARPRGYTRLIVWLGVVGAFSTLAYVGRYAGSGAGADNDDLLYEWQTFVDGLVQYVFMLAIVLGIAAGGPARELLALHRPRSWPVAIGLAFLVLIGTFVVTAVLQPIGNPGEEQGLLPDGWDASRAAPFVANAVLIAGFGPVVEELMFRGLGYSLLRPFGAPVAIVVVGVLFGTMHGLLIALPILSAFGIGLAWLRHRTESVYPGILLHAVFNAIALVAAVSVGDG